MFEPQNDEIVGNRRLLQVGEKVKGQIPSRKKPFAMPVSRHRSPPSSTGEKSLSDLTIRGSGQLIKDEMRGLDSDPKGYPYSIAAGVRFRATSPCWSQLFALQARSFEVDLRLIPGLSTDVDAPVETDGADRGRWRVVGAFCYDFGRMAGPVE